MLSAVESRNLDAFWQTSDGIHIKMHATNVFDDITGV